MVSIRGLVLCGCVVLCSCIRTVQMNPPYAEPVFTPTYVYQQISPDLFQVWTPTRAGLLDAKEALGCGVCTEEPRGSLYVYRIQRFKQPER